MIDVKQEVLQELDPQPSLIDAVFGADMIKKLFYHCCRYDIDDNNEKAEMLSELLGPDFEEVGTGTNRMAYKRSAEFPEGIIKCYETNMLILVEEYVTLMEYEEFVANEVPIKELLSFLAENGYIFEDIGFNTKNINNYGYRADGTIVILDAGYIYPLGPNKEDTMSCPNCSNRIKYNNNYTGFVCTECRKNYSFMAIRRRMKKDMEDVENIMISELGNMEMPDFDNFVDDMYNKL